MTSKWNSRKFWLTQEVIVLGTIALFTGHLDGAYYAGVLAIAHLFYQASNAYDSRTDASFPRPPVP